MRTLPPHRQRLRQGRDPRRKPTEVIEERVRRPMRSAWIKVSPISPCLIHTHTRTHEAQTPRSIAKQSGGRATERIARNTTWCRPSLAMLQKREHPQIGSNPTMQSPGLICGNRGMMLLCARMSQVIELLWGCVTATCDGSDRHDDVRSMRRQVGDHHGRARYVGGRRRGRMEDKICLPICRKRHEPDF